MVRMYSTANLVTDEWFCGDPVESHFTERTPRTIGLSIALIGASSLSRTKMQKGEPLKRISSLVYDFTSLTESDSAALAVFGMTQPTSYKLFRLSIELLSHELDISEYLALSERFFCLAEQDRKISRSMKHWLLQYYLEACASLLSHTYWSDEEKCMAHESLLTLVGEKLSREKVPNDAEQEYIDRLLSEQKIFQSRHPSGCTLEIEGPSGKIVYSADFQRAHG